MIGNASFENCIELNDEVTEEVNKLKYLGGGTENVTKTKPK